MPRFRVVEIGTFWNVWEVEGKDRDDVYKNIIPNLELEQRVRDGKEQNTWEIEELREGEDA